MRAGSLDRLVRIEEAPIELDALDDHGHRVQSWLLVETVWCAVTPLKGEELFASQQFTAKVDTRFRMRWRDDITASDTFRLVHEGRPFDIKHVSEIGRREGLDVLAMARAE